MIKVTKNAATGETNIQVDQNADFNLSITYKDEAGDPINLTTYTGKMQIRTGYSEPDAVVTLTDGSGLTLGGAAGTIAVHVSAAQNAGLDGKRAYVYDLVLTNPSNQVRILEGIYFIDPGVTR